MKYWHPPLPFGQHISVFTLVLNLKKKLKKCKMVFQCIVNINVFFMPPRRRVGGHINLPCPSVRLAVRPSVCPSGYRYMVCSAISSYSFGATALIFCGMFIHMLEVCMSTGFWLSSNILKMTGSWTYFFRTSCIKGTWFVRLTPPTVLELQL
jgi:hypothetical protein